jgi:hypothetical protein
VASFTFRPPYPQGKSRRSSLQWRMVLGAMAKKPIPAPAGSRIPVVQPITMVTDWATTATLFYRCVVTIHGLAGIASPHPHEGNPVSWTDVILFWASDFRYLLFHQFVGNKRSQFLASSTTTPFSFISVPKREDAGLNATFGQNVYFWQTNRATPIQAKAEKPSVVN